jgi:hypothetical protein
VLPLGQLNGIGEKEPWECKWCDLKEVCKMNHSLMHPSSSWSSLKETDQKNYLGIWLNQLHLEQLIDRSINTSKFKTYTDSSPITTLKSCKLYKIENKDGR